MKSLMDKVEQFVAIDNQPSAGNLEMYHCVAAAIHNLCSEILLCERLGYTRQDILQALAPARMIHGKSPFIRRAQTWPRGYPGDFETIEYLLHPINRAAKGTLEYFCEEYALNSPITQQHRNKVLHQAARILETFRTCHFPKVLSIACGSCPDIRLIASHLKGCQGQIVLIDMDAEALTFSKSELELLGDLCQFIPGNIFNVIRRLGQGAYDLVLAGGGVCDYLSDKEVRFLIDIAQRKLLKPGGSIFLTNIATGNPYRPWMEYLADWFLIERSEEDILQICYSLGLQDEIINIQRDGTGLTLMVELTKRCEQEWSPRLASFVTTNSSRLLAQLPQEGERMEKN
jgi:extracellular factor (EF) 3-hydroxypalmitic acid methyl ester biosynthesis protein